ncbi:methionine ABC transporter ATP-binding protein [Desulfofustis glycolicus]|uniref:D-methionine transport system ATP-binding protein n=1 Tax=Desulfofustis glycolicus DSM 9705 TaxID=1121409 RepID=A0A1M5WPU5_9BACT|nr:ATP-binding cassette domain-containing protein [Desulfofustis glycolicus]MCB2218734.1 ATP-binding cassette domain-containing protein [Desulfobulbaceae bacterium]SHH89402.1 D-methionine transport system ATP-binding protein [Desulfofustis glycolicus DSM 9705]
MILSRNIRKSFGKHQILKGIDLHIGKGRIFGLAGRSGAGKSTFLRCINGIEPYDDGSLQVAGVELATLRDRQLRSFRKSIGMVFQQFSLLERLTVFENVALPMKCWNYDNRTIRTRVDELLGLVGLSAKRSQKPWELSGGQKQRVAIARALSLTPEILLCDEATSALDPKTAQEILLLLKGINLQLGITIVMVTHQMSVLTGICDEMAIMEGGRVDCQGAVETIFRQQPKALRNLLGSSRASAESSDVTTTVFLVDKSDVVARMVFDLDVMLHISKVPVSGAGLLVNVPADRFDEVTRYLDQRQVNWYPEEAPDPSPAASRFDRAEPEMLDQCINR